MAITTYKLNADERALIGGGFTHIAKIPVENFTAANHTLYTCKAGDVVLPNALLYIKTAPVGGSALVGNLGTHDGSSYTLSLIPSKILTSATAGGVYSPTGAAATVEKFTPYASGALVQFQFTTVTGTYTDGEIWAYFSVAQLEGWSGTQV